MARWRRSRDVLARCLPILSLLIALPAHAQQGGWQVIAQPGGYKVARASVNGSGLGGIGLTCERNLPVIALNLTQMPRRNPAQLTLTSGTATANLGITRNGSTNVWVAVVKDTRVLDMLANGQRVDVAVDGAALGAASLVGARAALGEALGGCYRPGQAAQPAASPAANGSIRTRNADEAAILRIVRAAYANEDAASAYLHPAFKAADQRYSDAFATYSRAGGEGEPADESYLCAECNEGYDVAPGAVRDVQFANTGQDQIDATVAYDVPGAKPGRARLRFQKSGGSWMIFDVFAADGTSHQQQTIARADALLKETTTLRPKGRPPVRASRPPAAPASPSRPSGPATTLTFARTATAAERAVITRAITDGRHTLGDDIRDADSDGSSVRTVIHVDMADANDDGRKDLFLQLEGSAFCGQGCAGYLILATATGYAGKAIMLANFGGGFIGNGRIAVLASAHNGMRDLRFDDGSHVFTWSGTEYR